MRGHSPASPPELLRALVEVKSETGWQVQGSWLSFVPLNTALSPFQVFIQGGCVKYYDPSPLSPASVAS